MYLTNMKSIAVKALRTTLDADYSEPDFRNIPVEIEYPVVSAKIPSVWVDFDPIGPLTPVGIGHYEDVPEYAEVDDALLGFHRSKRWSFAGNITYTVVTMSSLERDRLLDEVITCIAFGEDDIQRSEFRRCYEEDPLIQLNLNWDTIDQRGFSASPGTPWGTDEMMYEGTIALQVIGEFVSTPGQTLLVPISSWTLYTWVNNVESDPIPGGNWIE